MRSKSFILVVSGVLLLCLLSTGVSAIDVTGCQPIFVPGTYVLQNDISTNLTYCIDIQSSDVYFDGNGKTIDGSKFFMSRGISIQNSSGLDLHNVVITNVKLTDWYNGIYGWHSDNMYVRNNQVSGADQVAIELGFADNSNIYENDASSNNAGFAVAFSNNVKVFDNIANDDRTGLYFQDVTFSLVTGNIVDNAIQDGFSLVRTTDTRFINNTVIGGNTSFSIAPPGTNARNTFSNNLLAFYKKWGFYLWQTTDNLFSHNNMTGEAGSFGVYWIDQIEGFNQFIDNTVTGGYTGMYIAGYSSRFTGNTISGTSAAGISLDFSPNNTLIDNVGTGNSQMFVNLYNSWNNNLINNTVQGNAIGFSLSNASYNLFWNNTITDSSDQGIRFYFDPASASNSFIDNYFDNTNNVGWSYGVGANIWNATRRSGTNIIGGPTFGGNYWATPSGTGFSQKCVDADSDGICDTSYKLNTGNVDNLPLTNNPPPGPLHADYVVDVSSGPYAPLTVTFTDISTGFPTRVNLSFGDGNWTNSTGSWVHTYTSEGTFFPVIYAWNSTGSDSRTNATISVGVFPGLDPEVASGYNLVLKKVLGGSIGNRAAFASLKKVKAKFRVDQWGKELARSVTAPDTDQNFYYINEYPERNYESLGKFVFTNLADNTVTVHKTFTPPENLETLQIAGETGGGGEVKALNSVTGPRVGSSGFHTLGAQASGTTSCSDVDCRHCHALLISGGYNRDMNRYSYYDDIATMYYILNTTYCYPPENIKVLLSDGTDPAEDIYDYMNYDTTPPTPVYRNSDPDLNGDGVSEVNGPATRENVLNNLTSLKDTLTEQDDLFIFTTNHGGNDTVPESNEARLWLWNREYVWDHEFMAAMEGIRAKNITMMMEQCYGGGFIDDFAASPTRVIATAANADESSVRDDFSYMWEYGVIYGFADQAYEGNRDGIVSQREAFSYANWTDWSSRNGDEHPQYSSNAPAAGETLGLGSCSKFKCPAPAVSLPGGEGLPQDPDGDCVYEDLNGDGTFNLADVVFFFNTLGWITDPANAQPIGPFDVNRNGRVDFGDIVSLYWDPSCQDCLKP